MKSDDIPMVHLGPVENDVPAWRDVPETGNDPDDDELKETPPDVVAVLGFDPAGDK